MSRIDSHQHFWNYDPRKHPWITDEMKVLQQDFMPPDLKKELDKVGMEGCVAVQADQSEEETDFLLSLADKYSFIKGVVGWLDIRGENFRQRLEHYCSHPKFKGLRHLVQDEPDDRFLMRSDFLSGMKTLSDFDLAYDILIFARHLPVAVEFVHHFPDQKFVLDHIAKPEIKEQNTAQWEEDIRELARHPRLYCKISGMVTEADWGQWTPEDFKPYLDVVFDAFGTERLMYGSDWPVCKLAADYEEVYRLVAEYIEPLSAREKDQILGGNAKQWYGL